VLFENINRLEELFCQDPIQREEIDRLLHFLDSYSAAHFHFEEQCMMRHSCPAHEENRRTHAEFREMLARFKQEYLEQGPAKVLLSKYHAVISNWIHGHVLNVDVKLRSAVTNVAVS
jgi:hemerythrin